MNPVFINFRIGAMYAFVRANEQTSSINPSEP